VASGRHRSGVDYSQEPTTLVVLELAESDGGVLLSVVKSGLDKIPLDEARRCLEMIAQQRDHALARLKFAVEK